MKEAPLPTRTLSPRELALAIGVSASSVKRWVDAGRIAGMRTAGGHRRIALGDALRFVRDEQLRILRPEVLGLPDRSIPADGPEGVLTGEGLLRVLESRDAARACGLITGAFLAGQRPAELFDGPIREALAALGARWRTDERAVYLEHQATALVTQAVHQLHLLIPPADRDAPVAVGCAPLHDPYILPSLMAATVLADRGYRVVNLGPHTPAAALAAAAATVDAHVVWVAVTSGHALVDDRPEWEETLRALGERHAQVVVGGQAAHRLPIRWPSGVRVVDTMTDLAAYA